MSLRALTYSLKGDSREDNHFLFIALIHPNFQYRMLLRLFNISYRTLESTRCANAIKVFIAGQCDELLIAIFGQRIDDSILRIEKRSFTSLRDKFAYPIS
jgi:hypothetical protein